MASMTVVGVKNVWQLCILDYRQCPLSGTRRRPLLGGLKCISSTEVAIRSAELARFSEVVRFSEGPLQEVLLYTVRWFYF